MINRLEKGVKPLFSQHFPCMEGRESYYNFASLGRVIVLIQTLL